MKLQTNFVSGWKKKTYMFKIRLLQFSDGRRFIKCSICFLLYMIAIVAINIYISLSLLEVQVI